jgi:hypothetical protein
VEYDYNRKYLKSGKNPETRKIPEKLPNSGIFLQNPEDLVSLVMTARICSTMMCELV